MPQEKITTGPRRVVFPTGNFISPGGHKVHTVHTVTTEQWEGEELVSSETVNVDEFHDIFAHTPGWDGPEDNENSWPERGWIKFLDKTWTIVRDDDIGFWGFRNGEPLTKQQWLEGVQAKNRAGIEAGAAAGWWNIDEQGNPQKLAAKFSIAALAAENKTLMAHLMVDLGFFPSVSQARKNGWDKPLELGRHELGPKKKRAHVEIVP